MGKIKCAFCGDVLGEVNGQDIWAIPSRCPNLKKKLAIINGELLSLVYDKREKA